MNKLATRLIECKDDTETIRQYLFETLWQVHGHPIGETGLRFDEGLFLLAADKAVEDLIAHFEV